MGQAHYTNYSPESRYLEQQKNWDALEHVRAYEALSDRLGPIVNDVRDAFFNLDSDGLRLLLSRYRRQYGNKAADYAQDAFPIWKSGGRKMSGQTAERILNLVPGFLSHDQRYNMIKRLCDHHAPAVYRHIRIDKDNVEKAYSELESAIDDMRNTSHLKYLPEDVLETVTWLYDADAVTARGLLSQIDQAMCLQVEKAIERNRGLMAALLAQKETKHYSETFDFPNGSITMELIDKSSCFVATAVYGDQFHPNVVALRLYRDQVLMKTRLGRGFVYFYYKVGPGMAFLVRQAPGLSGVIRIWLDMLVGKFKKESLYD